MNRSRAVRGWLSPSPQLASTQIKDILHVVEAGSLLNEPLRCTDRAVVEGDTTRGFVDTHDAFDVRHKHHGMVTHYIAAAHGSEPDGVAGTGTDLAFAGIDGHLVQLTS